MRAMSGMWVALIHFQRCFASCVRAHSYRGYMYMYMYMYCTWTILILHTCWR